MFVVEGCSKICTDSFVKEELVNVQKELEDIRSGDEYKARGYLTADEKVIAFLLSVIIDNESAKDAENFDGDAFDTAVDWFLTVKGQKVRLSDEEIAKQVAEIFRVSDAEKASEE